MLTGIEQAQTVFGQSPALLVILLAWTLFWKGLALWKAARLSHKRWFIIILVLNTLGIADIIYLYFIARKYTVVSETEEKAEEDAQ